MDDQVSKAQKANIHFYWRETKERSQRNKPFLSIYLSTSLLLPHSLCLPLYLSLNFFTYLSMYPHINFIYKRTYAIVYP